MFGNPWCAGGFAVWSRPSVSVMCDVVRVSCVLHGWVRTCDKGSIGARRSCLREACRPGLGSLLWEELVFDGVLRSRPGDGRLDDEAVSGLTTGMVSSAQLDSCACMRQPLHCLEGTWQGKLPTWTRHEKPVWETGQDWAGSTRL
jgi:hypothetical protein